MKIRRILISPLGLIAMAAMGIQEYFFKIIIPACTTNVELGALSIGHYFLHGKIFEKN